MEHDFAVTVETSFKPPKGKARLATRVPGVCPGLSNLEFQTPEGEGAPCNWFYQTYR